MYSEESISGYDKCVNKTNYNFKNVLYEKESFTINCCFAYYIFK